MEWNQLIWVIVPLIPSVLSGVIIARFNKFDRESEKRNQSRKTENILILKNMDAIGTLSELTTKCLKGETLNGELDKALEYRKKMKHDMEDYLMDVTAETNCR